MDSHIKNQIEEDIKKNKVLVYMKGTPEAPQCGFSAQVASLFKSKNVKFASRNILENEDLRQAIKEFTEWPTIPQVFINGELIGGCDIVMELNTTGELDKLLNT